MGFLLDLLFGVSGGHTCSYCYGSGKCSFCKGTGQIDDIDRLNPYNEDWACPTCGGNGKCHACRGTGKIYRNY